MCLKVGFSSAKGPIKFKKELKEIISLILSLSKKHVVTVTS